MIRSADAVLVGHMSPYASQSIQKTSARAAVAARSRGTTCWARDRYKAWPVCRTSVRKYQANDSTDQVAKMATYKAGIR